MLAMRRSQTAGYLLARASDGCAEPEEHVPPLIATSKCASG
jgi:hypothetical protein